jgi:hypothetical protein
MTQLTLAGTPCAELGHPLVTYSAQMRSTWCACGEVVIAGTPDTTTLLNVRHAMRRMFALGGRMLDLQHGTVAHANARTSMDDLRTALSIARGCPLDQIDSLGHVGAA